MQKRAFLLIFIIAFVSCKTDKKPKGTVVKEEIIANTKIELLNYETLKPFLHKKDNKTYVINFWATWCKPCVEELPVFEKLHDEYKDKNVEVILISLDFPNQVEKRLIPFIKEHNLQSKVLLMSDPDQNTWIPKIDEKWSGAIPATLIYNKDMREFYEQSFTYDLLLKELNKFLKTN